MAQETELQAGLRIRVVTAPYFLATKLEAFRGRKRGDYANSHDLESPDRDRRPRDDRSGNRGNATRKSGTTTSAIVSVTFVCVSSERWMPGSLHESFWPGSACGDEEDGDDFGRHETLCTNCAPNKLGQCGKLLKVNAGEVAERLKAAVC